MLWVVTLMTFSAFGQEATGYTLGPGDVIQITVYGESDLTRQLTLTEDGRVNYAFVGEFVLSGLSIPAVEQLITDKLRGDYLINPQVSVTMAEYRPFYISGEVNSPGSYPYEPGLTVSKAISIAGGLTERASERKIFLVPNGGTEQEQHRVSLDDRVSPGDTITIEQSLF